MICVVPLCYVSFWETLLDMSAKTYKTSKGVKWKTNVWLTAPFCPGIVFADLFIMNLIPWVEESSVPSPSVLGQKSLQCGLEFQYH